MLPAGGVTVVAAPAPPSCHRDSDAVGVAAAAVTATTASVLSVAVRVLPAPTGSSSSPSAVACRLNADPGADEEALMVEGWLWLRAGAGGITEGLAPPPTTPSASTATSASGAAPSLCPGTALSGQFSIALPTEDSREDVAVRGRPPPLPPSFAAPPPVSAASTFTTLCRLAGLRPPLKPAANADADSEPSPSNASSSAQLAAGRPLELSERKRPLGGPRLSASTAAAAAAVTPPQLPPPAAIAPVSPYDPDPDSEPRRPKELRGSGG